LRREKNQFVKILIINSWKHDLWLLAWIASRNSRDSMSVTDNNKKSFFLLSARLSQKNSIHTQPAAPTAAAEEDFWFLLENYKNDERMTDSV
jgi:hypothetical protein